MKGTVTLELNDYDGMTTLIRELTDNLNQRNDTLDKLMIMLEEKDNTIDVLAINYLKQKAVYWIDWDKQTQTYEIRSWYESEFNEVKTLGITDEHIQKFIIRKTEEKLADLAEEQREKEEKEREAKIVEQPKE